MQSKESLCAFIPAGMQNGTATLEDMWCFLKLNVLLPQDPAIQMKAFNLEK